MPECIYGPVPSRRLGRSLGVDLLPAKICTYNCVYCQLGKSSAKTVKRRAYRDVDTVIEQLRDRLAEDIKLDCITLAGSGEPTLNSDIGQVISQIKKCADLPVVVLTNGSLLPDPDVRSSLMAADIVIPSLDAHSSKLFETINRPHHSIDFDQMVGGIADFSKEFRGQLWLEIFIMEGINAALDNANAFHPLVERIGPDKIYVNTAVRPPAESFVRPVSNDRIAEFYNLLDKQPQQDVKFTRYQPADSPADQAEGDMTADIFALIARRPVTKKDIVNGLGLTDDSVQAGINELLAQGKIDAIEKNQQIYYRETTA